MILNTIGIITLILAVVSKVKSSDQTHQPEVSTPYGNISGFYMNTREGRTISAFTSIPYALPPLDDLRFKAPIPIVPWEKTYDATKPSPPCVQRNPYTRQKEIVGQEDCLYLNIYTPRSENSVDDDKLLPVMVFLHGGGWMCGDSSTKMYGPQYLLDRDIVFVATNYRLGPLGFLSTQDNHCPGNNGLKDQQEALRFIQNIITSFGGDKNSVTIFGESAGGASVSYHMISETSVGLFHKAISESGTALVPWAEAPPGEALRNGFRLAKFLNCPQAPSEKMISCLKKRSAYDIINTEFQFYEWDYEPMTPFKAVVEPDLPGAFLTRSPREVPDVPAVPWITGLNKDEGCLKSVWITINSTRFDEFVAGFDTIGPVTYYYENSPFIDLITEKLKETYFVAKDAAAIESGILEMYSDSYFDYPAVQSVELIFNYTKNPVYLYDLTYKGANSFSQIFGDPDGDYGVCHADDLMYLFPIDFLKKPMTDHDIRMSKLIVTLWTNFATSGNPNKPSPVNFKWKEATSSSKMEYIDLGFAPKMMTDLASRSRFWGTLPMWYNFRGTKRHEEL